MLSHRKKLVYLGLTLLGAVFVLVYRGPLWPFVRGYMGDWLVVQFIYVIARFWVNYRWHYRLAIIVFLFSILVEVVQYFAASVIPSTFVADVTVGRTFDPVDIAAYALGVITVLLIDHYWKL